ncbi:cofactor assembly of complex C subunit B [Oscillatoria sp. FACHB-1406]|uniref:cofactor assembly of complex C subunit B n=1 Tax=Oscillatoria sp. FACHB-1406 TaxID=2692846 RepID=UPI001686DC11|nr:cofactor assembly of complex C subunit B [Oscillatoria sp. FACHB-1406]
MNSPILSSTFFLTILLLVGLFFFIRASVKPRTEQIQLAAELPEDVFLSQLQAYFEQRAYRLAALDREQQQITFQGFVRPSWFLAIFLSLLAALGLLCSSLILSFLYPERAAFFFALILLSPLAGWFYWKKAGRLEQVRLKIEAMDAESNRAKSLVTVTGHRDELAELQKAMQLPAKAH